MSNGETRCPLCSTPNSGFYSEDLRRRYRRCRQCKLVFVPAEYFLSAADERTHYDLHQNSPSDPNYRGFLKPVLNAICDRVTPPARGLDFGCGPGPTLSCMLEEAGYQASIYDPFYANDPSVLDGDYDFISCTEVAEHLHYPGTVFAQLFSLLKAGGWLAIMTRQLPAKDRFANWHYKNDPTHVCFYARATFAYLAARFNAHLEVISTDLVLLQKTVDPS